MNAIFFNYRVLLIGCVLFISLGARAQQIATYTVPAGATTVALPLNVDHSANQGAPSGATCNGGTVGNTQTVYSYQWGSQGTSWVGSTIEYQQSSSTVYTCINPAPSIYHWNAGTAGGWITTGIYATISTVAVPVLGSISGTICGGSVVNLTTGSSAPNAATVTYLINGSGIGSPTSVSLNAYDNTVINAQLQAIYTAPSSNIGGGGQTTATYTTGTTGYTVYSKSSDAGSVTGTTSYCPGASASLSVTARTGYTYQWYANGAPVGTGYSGGTTNNLTFTTNSGMNGVAYSCTIKDVCSVPYTPTGVTLTVYGQVGIGSSPSSGSVCPSSTIHFTGSANPTYSSINYRWQVASSVSGPWSDLADGGEISGSGTNNLAFTPISGSTYNNRYFRFRAWDGCSSGTYGGTNENYSSAAQLTLYVPVGFSAQPSGSVSLCPGQTFSTSVNATGTSPFTYQWQKAGVNISSATGSTFSIGSVAASDASTYAVVVSNVCSSPATTSETLNVYTPVGITTQPTSPAAVCPNATSVHFAVTASGTSPTYQWQVSTNSGSSWANASDGALYTGSATASLTLTGSNITSAMNNYLYRCIVSSGVSCGAAQTSNSGTLTVYSIVGITTQPSATQSLCPGSAFSLSVVASGSSPTYQWNKNGATIISATSASFSIASVAASDAATYSVTVTSGVGCNNVTSSNAVLAVYTPVGITTQPTATQSLCPGSAFSLSVVASGSSPTYQWNKNGAAINGATSASFSITSVAASDAATYTVTVTSGVGCNNVTSSNAVLAVYTPVGITTQPSATQSLCPGSAYSLSVVASGSSPTYQWNKNGAAITGATSASFSITSVAASDAATYTVTVTSGVGCNNLTSSNAVLAVYAPVGITTQPTATQSLCPGSAFSLSVVASGSSPTYQWNKNGAAITGETSASFSIVSVAASDAATYTVTVTSGVGCNNVTSSNAVLAVYTPVGITTQPTATQSLCPGSAFSLSVVASGSSPTYQWNKNGAAITGAISASFSIASVALSDAATYTVTVTSGVGCNNLNSSNAVLSVYSPPVITTNLSSLSYCSGSNVNLTVVGTTSPGALTYVWKLSTDGGTTWNTISNIAPYSGATTGTLTIASVPLSYTGYKFQVFVSDGTCTTNATSSAIATITPYANVTTSNPVSLGICPGNNTSFSVVGTSHNGAANYQWQVNQGAGFVNVTNGGVYSGATSSTLSLTAVTASFNGYKYQVFVSDGCGLVTQAVSSPATLTIYSGAAITTQPMNSTICQGGNTSFTVIGSSSSGSLNYQWWVDPNTGTPVSLSNSAVYNGATAATLNLTAPPNSYAGYKFYVVVTDGCSALSVQSATVKLGFYSTLQVTTVPISQTVCPNAAAAFTIAATPNTGSLSWQWQLSTNNGTSFSNVSNAGIYSGATAATLNIGSASLLMNGYLYRVIVNDGCGPSTQYTSPPVTLTVNNSVSISNDLAASTTPCVNGLMSLSVAASGTSLSYQWQENSGTTWANISNVGIYSGALTNNLTISSVPIGYNGYQYRLQIVGSCSSATSAVTIVSIIVPPTITTEPTNTTVCAGTPANFTVSASGSSPTYQWQYSSTGVVGSFTNIPNATSSTYTITSVTAANGGIYIAIASNGCGSNQTLNTLLTVNPVTSISTQPINVAVCPTYSTSFNVVAAGAGPFSYSWQVSTNNGSTWSPVTNTGVYSGSATNTLSLASLTIAYNSYQYQASVTGSCGAPVISSTAVLTVNPTPNTPVVPAPAICGTGQISATASSSSPTPTYNWYLNQSDLTATYSGATYTILSLAQTTTYYATVVSLSCESPKQSVVYTINTPTSVGLGGPLTLCLNQGKYDLSQNIVQSNATSGTFSWKDANNVLYSGNFFDPTIGVGTYTVTYVPLASVETPPTCYISSQRTVTVISSTGSQGISFLAPTGSPTVNGGNSINSCAGDNAINLSTYVTPSGGTWQTSQGSGLSGNGSNVIFTPTTNNLSSPSTPNEFTYTVSIGGCTGSSMLSIYVSTNANPPVLSGLPAIVCPGSNLTLGATVNATGTFNYNWYNGNNAFAASGGSIAYKVKDDTTLYVRSVNTPFGCLSPPTSVNIVTPFTSGAIGVNQSSITYGNVVDFTYTGSTNGISYLWNFGDGGYPSTDQNPEHPYYKQGTFTVTLTLTSTLNCTKALSYSSIVVAGDVNVITADTGPQFYGLNVFPIPTKDQFSITSENQLSSVTLYDLQGRPMIVKDCSGLFATSISTGPLASGLYILLIQDNTGVKSVKIIKE